MHAAVASILTSLPARRMLGAGILALATTCVQGAPRVAASIAPLQLIAAAVMDGTSVPELVLGPGQDPHEISLRPSERRIVADADLLLWIGPSLELPLADIVAEREEVLLTVQDLDDVALLYQGDIVDPHLWLGVDNVRAIARALAERLIELDAAQQPAYRDNLARFEAALDASLAQARTRAADASPTAWAVYHHAFRYLEADLDLPPAITMTDANGNLRGVRALVATRDAMREARIDCVLVETGVDADKVRNLLDLPTLEVTSVDILGMEQRVDAAGFTHMYDLVAERAITCANGAPQ